MKFDFSDEQYALRDAVRELFDKEASPTRLREVWKSGERDARVWQAMAEMGVTGLTVPEAYGGAGGSEIDLTLVLEEAGRACMPEPLIETVGVAAPMIAAHGSDDQKQAWLPHVTSGDSLLSVQIGAAPFAVDADIADALIIEHAGTLHLISRDAYTATRVTTEDVSRRLFKIDVTTPLSDATTLGDASAPRDAHDRAATAAAAVLNGIASRLVDMTVAYVKGRQQFGRPVGSFQAVKHKLASAHVLVESSRAATWYASYAIAGRLADRSVAAATAKACANDAEALANTEALQCHGGIGFTWEQDLHFWLKRGRALEQAYGTTAECRAALAAYVFEELAHA